MIALLEQPHARERIRAQAFAFAWFLWLRQRNAVALVGVYIAATSIVVRFVRIDPSVVPVLCIPLGILVLVMLGERNEVREQSETRAPSSFFLRSPVSSRAMVFWPMIYGILAIFLVWYMFVWLVATPAGWSAPPVWPPLMMVMLYVWLLAIGHTRFSQSEAMLFVLIIPVVAVAGIVSLAVLTNISPWILSGVCLALSVPAYPIAVAGLSHSRCGETIGPNFRLQLVPEWIRRIVRERQPQFVLNPRTFRSAVDAQEWLEWRTFGLLLQAVPYVGWLTLLGALIEHQSVRIGAIFTSLPPCGIAGVEVMSPFLIMAVLDVAVILVMFSVLQGLGMGIATRGTGLANYVPHLFLATRPMTCSTLVELKLKVAARSTRAFCVAVSVFLLLVLLSPAQDGGIAGPLGLLLLRHAAPLALVRAFVITIGLIYMIWKLQSDALFVGLEGGWVLCTCLFLVFAVLLILLAIASRSTVPPELYRYAVASIPPCVVVACVLKLGAMPAVAKILVQRGLVEESRLRRSLKPWCAVAFAAAVVAMLVTPSTLAAPWLVASVVVLLMPGVRVMLCPILLERNRHQ